MFGLWHLGCVTAACVAEHYPVTGVDPDARTIDGLRHAQPPIFEPGLSELIAQGLSRGALAFSTGAAAAAGAEIVWVTFDTPVDESDQADFAYVERQVENLFPHLAPDAIVILSSQVPVGTTARIAARYREKYPAGTAGFVYSPENLRLGKALEAFRHPGRIVVGVLDPAIRGRLGAYLAPFSTNVIWMSAESAEMTKHALNAFLADSIVFMNEIAALCERVGADAKQVEMGLKSEERIGQRAYLSPGGAFAGGTLARDVAFLSRRAEEAGVATPLLASIQASNEFHKTWPRRKLETLLGSLDGKAIALLGLTYKPGTDTLRRSAAIELARWAETSGAKVRAFDPAVRSIPPDVRVAIQLCDSAVEALRDCDAAVLATAWPQFRELREQDFTKSMRTPILIDASRFLEAQLGNPPRLIYAAVGRPREIE